jgi:hypothetical protein
MRRGRVIAAVGVGVVVAVMLPTTSASAATLRCGDTIIANVVLTRNLNCSGDGLVLGADGLTIDLNGYTLSGSGGGTGIGAGGSGRRGISVLNGTIRNFDNGITNISGGSSLTGLKVVGNNYGAGRGLLEAVVSGSTFRDNQVAISPSRVTVTDSTFVSNGIGILGNSSGNTNEVTSSTFRENTEGIRCYDNNTHVANSKFVDNTTGIYSVLLCGLRVHDSFFTGGEVAVQLGRQVGFWLDVQRNTFAWSKIGIEIAGDFAATDGYVIADNTFTNNGATGLYLHIARDLAPTISMPVSGNAFMGNGFWHDPYVAPSGNVLNAGVWANTGTFTDNRAVNNGGYGIEGHGVIDGGGNVAKRNGNPDQCLGVICTR